MKTLDSLVNCTSKQQFSEIFIVILLADFNVTWRLEMASMIKDRYTPLVTNGAIQVIEAPREFYPPLDNLQHTYNDSQLFGRTVD
jgi:alpha-1,3-mannosylglycoprotein beta-1,4-N-acetylglucosaminyltransferase C